MSHLNDIATKVANLNHLRQLHAHLVHHSFHYQNHWVGLLLSHCSKLLAPFTYARSVFSSATEPDLHVFASMLKYYSQVGSRETDVLWLFKHMQKLGIKPPGIPFFPILIKAAGKASFMMFHAQAVRLGHVDERYVKNAIMGAYAKHGGIEPAWKMFDEMTERSSADWNVMIGGCWKLGNEEEAKRIFHLMNDSERNVITWTTMITGYAKLKDLNSARMYFDKMPERNVVSWNAVLTGYVQSGAPEEALRLFDDMLDSGIEPNETTWVTVISSCSSIGDPCIADSLVRRLNRKNDHSNYYVKTALLDMHAKCGNLEAAQNIFNQLGLFRNIISWNAMISAYARVGDLSSARRLFDKMQEKNTVSWNSMIAGYAQNGESLAALDLFKEMITSKDSRPDEVTMVSAVSACGHLGALELGNWAVSILKENKINLSISGYNSMIFMYSRCGSMEDATRIFQEMEVRDVVSYNTLISGYAAHGHGLDAVNLLSKMEEERIKPDRITYIGALTACSHEGLLEEGQKIFESIEVPNVDHYACLIDLLCRVGKLEEAVELISTMPMEPHAGIFGSLLSACLIHKRIKLGELTAAKLFKLEPHNSGNYVLLSNIYASAGRWEDVDRVRKKMIKQGLKKSTGWSWVEHKGQINKFIVGDRSHARSDDIYNLLIDLRTKMRNEGYVEDKSCVLRDVEEEEKEEMVGVHSEKLAVCFGLLVSEMGTVIRVAKNLRICGDCHTSIKIISKLEGRKIIVRDNNRFHCFSDGFCSCKDYW